MNLASLAKYLGIPMTDLTCWDTVYFTMEGAEMLDLYCLLFSSA